MSNSWINKWVLSIVMVSVGFLCHTKTSLAAVTEWTLKQEFAVEQPPLAIVAAPEGKILYVLVPGKVLLYSVIENRMIDFVPVDKDLDRLTYTGRDNLFILSSSKGNLVKIFKLDSRARIDLSGLPYKGKETAPLTIAVYSDYQCPYCGRLEPLLKQVLDKYPNEVKMVFKNYPLEFHKFARIAATASLAAYDQGKYWEFHDKLFENYASLNEDKIQGIAHSLKLDVGRFNKKRMDPGIQEIINRDVAEAQDNGVTGTPTIFINGKLLKDRSFEAIQEIIRVELKNL